MRLVSIYRAYSDASYELEYTDVELLPNLLFRWEVGGGNLSVKQSNCLGLSAC
jgi:hypothetical protein